MGHSGRRTRAATWVAIAGGVWALVSSACSATDSAPPLTDVGARGDGGGVQGDAGATAEGGADAGQRCPGEGTSCDAPSVCELGVVQCGDAGPFCGAGPHAPNGQVCGVDKVCADGLCIACTPGLACSSSDPCKTGMVACGQGHPACVAAGNVTDGTVCGAARVCEAGSCVACAADLACVPSGDPCHVGKLTSCSGQPGACVDQQTYAAPGTACGDAKVCGASGACVTCNAGAACRVAAACRSGRIACNTGAPLCVDSGPAPPGTPCGGDAGASVCDPNGVCALCNDGAPCTPSNACHAGHVSCASGGPLCIDDATSAGDGAACGPQGSGQSCVAGVCACAAGQHLCGASCVSKSSLATCGKLCTPCPTAPAGAVETCDGTACGFTCAGLACDAERADGCGNGGCTCGAGPACAPGQLCNQSVCR
jgi:hypothetical protein